MAERDYVGMSEGFKMITADVDIMALAEHVKHTAQGLEAAREAYRVAEVGAETAGRVLDEASNAFALAQNALLVAASGTIRGPEPPEAWLNASMDKSRG